MFLTISELQLDAGSGFSAIRTACIDLAYALKPSRQSWDLLDDANGNYTNIGIDWLKFSFDKAGHELENVNVGDQLKLKVVSDAGSIATTYIVDEVAFKDGKLIVLAKPELGARVIEA